MANHKSSKKRIRQTAAKRAHNRLYHKTARNAVKALRNTSEKSAAEALLPKVTTMLDKLAKHNIVHKNKAANLKRALQLHVNALSTPAGCKARSCPCGSFFIPLRKTTVSATVPPAQVQRTHTLRHTACTTKPPASLRAASVFPRRASPRGTTLPGDPPDPPAASLLPGKPGSVPGITPFLESLGP